MQETIPTVFVHHGSRVQLTCCCGKTFTIPRPVEGDTSLFHCQECGLKRMYRWPKRDQRR